MQIRRILSIISKLSLGPETVASLHHKLVEEGLKVSQRTIYRDLMMLEDTFRLGAVRLARFDGEFNKASWMITAADEKSAVRDDLFFKTFVTENLKPDWEKYFTGNTIEDVFSGGNAINATEAAVIQKSVSQFSLQNSNWGEFIYHHEHYNRLKDIIWAISHQRIIHIVFFDHTAETEYRFRPLRVIYHRGALNVLGWRLHEDSARLHFQELDCIRTTSITNERYQHPDEEAVIRQALNERFGIHDSIDREPQKIVLEMGKGPAIFLKNRIWHPTQSFREENGKYYMEFTSSINIELVGWIFSWLEHIKAIAPESLVKIMTERADFICRMYREGNPPVSPSDTDNPFIVGA
jgi:predicted DNA-binding transcriptional regulator YafY